MVQPTPKTAPALTGNLPAKVIGTVYDDTPQIFISEAVLEQIIDFSERQPRREVGGFLIGGLHQDRSIYVQVRHFVPARQTRSRGASVVFTHDTWAVANRQIEARFKGQLMLGWHHTHPRLGIFLSGYDRFIQRHFFREYWQIALVVDPQRRELGFFQWRRDEIVDCGFVFVPSSGGAH